MREPWAKGYWTALLLCAALPLSAAALLLARPARAADGPLPEVLLVVDNSASMQYRLFADQPPTCTNLSGGGDKRSRWTAVREMISGTFLDYRCQTEALGPTAEEANPLPQTNGLYQCIPGLPSVINPNTVTYLPSTSSLGSSVGAGTSASLYYQAAAQTGSQTLPYVVVDLTNIPAGALTAGQLGFTVTGSTYGAADPTQLVAVLLNFDPASDPQKFRCLASATDRLEASNPTAIGGAVAGATLNFTWNKPGLQALQGYKASGKTKVWVALAHALSKSVAQGSCSGNSTVTPLPTTGKTLSLANLVGKVKFAVTSGTQCPGEGPASHSRAWGIDENGLATQKPHGLDGLIDVFGPGAKFALLGADTVLNKGVDLNAGFSFAGTLLSSWGEINHGMRDPFAPASGSVQMTRKDTLAERSLTHAAIHAALQATVPSGPTPLASQLQDVLQYLGPGTYMDAHFKSSGDDPANGDPYVTCRKKMVVVFSDGGANLHDGSGDGRALAIQAASKIWAAKIPVYVVAVGFPGDGTGGPADADLKFLNDLAVAGGTQAALPASTPLEVAKFLAPAILGAQLDKSAYGRPAVTNATGIISDLQHVIRSLSAFDIAQPLRTFGVIEQRVFSCANSCKDPNDPNYAQVCEVIDYGARLLARTVPRRLYTQLIGARLPITGASLPATDLGIGTVGLQPHLETNALGDCVTTGGFDLAKPAERDDYRDHLLAALRAEAGTCRVGKPLGAPSRSQPAILDPADRTPLREPSFRSYAAATVPTSTNYSTLMPPGSAGRPTMAFAATHDGLLHAFRTDRNAKITTLDKQEAGDELWGWLPRFSLRRLASMKLITSPASSYMGGSIVAQHVQLHRTAGQSVAEAARNWRAVVVVGAGEAGSGYVALDVTAPDDPQLLWEINPETHCIGPKVSVAGVPGPLCFGLPTYQMMGRSTAKPAIGNLFYSAQPGADPAQHAAVVLPYGLPPSLAGAANLGVEGLGQRGVLVVELESGVILRKFETADLDVTGMPQSLASKNDLGYFYADPACYDATPGQLTSRCFLGDSRGMLWRLDLSSSKPNEWKLQFFHDAYGSSGTPVALHRAITSPDRAPVASAPSISTNREGQLVVIYGTGDPTDNATASRLHVVHSLSETFAAGASGEPSSSVPVAKTNWVKAMGAFERFVGPPTVFALYAYWSSWSMQLQGACQTGTARLWGARYEKAQSASDLTDLWGAFANPSTPANKAANLDYVEIGSDRPSPVDVQAIPACRGACNPTDANCVAQLGSGAAQAVGSFKSRFQLSVSSGNSAVQSANQTPKGGAAPSVGSVAAEVPQPRTSAVVTGWDLLVD